MIILISSAKNIISKLPLENKRKIALIPNAELENKLRIKGYALFLKENGFNVSIIDLNKFKGNKLYNKLIKYEIIYIVGGNTFVLLQKIRESEFDKILPKLLEHGIVYVGQSAGAVVMGTSIEPTKLLDNPEDATLTNYNGLGYVDFVFIPHYKNPKYAAKMRQIEKIYSKKFKLRKFTDSEGLIIDNGVIRKI